MSRLQRLTISVLIADGNEIFQAGLSRSLNTIQYVGKICTAQNGEELLTIMNNINFNVIILDIGVDENIVRLVKKIRFKFPKVKIIGLSTFNSTSAIVAVMRSGANGFLLKNSSLREIDNAIQVVLSGKECISEVIQEGVNAHCWENSFLFNENDSLKSQHMREMLYLICKEKTSAEISKHLMLSEKTVEKYRQELLRSTGSKNVVGLVLFAIRNNIHSDERFERKYTFSAVSKIS